MSITKKQIETTFKKVHPFHYEMGVTNEKIYLLTEKLQKMAQSPDVNVFEKEEVISQLAELRKVKIFKPLQFLVYGESGVGKTFNTIKSYTELGIPIVMLESAAESDNAYYTGLPYRKETESGKMQTMKALPEYLPEMVVLDGEIQEREDGGILWDYDAMGDKILNREELMEFYGGDINKAPYMVLLLDDVNKTPLEEVKLVHFVLQNIYDNFTLEGKKTPQLQIILTGNPESAKYSTNGMFDDTAVISRLVCLKVEADAESVLSDIKDMDYEIETMFLLNSNPNLIIPEVDDEDWAPAYSKSHRSGAIMNSLIKVFKDDLTLLQSTLEGVFGMATAIDIVNVLRQGIELPSAKDILCDFENSKPLVQQFVGMDDAEETQQGVVYTMNESIIDYLNQNKDGLISKGFLYSEEQEQEIIKKAEAEGKEPVLATNQLINLGEYLSILPLPQRLALLKELVAMPSFDDEGGTFHLHYTFYKNQSIVKMLRKDMTDMNKEKNKK